MRGARLIITRSKFRYTPPKLYVFCGSACLPMSVSALLRAQLGNHIQRRHGGMEFHTGALPAGGKKSVWYMSSVHLQITLTLLTSAPPSSTVCQYDYLDVGSSVFGAVDKTSSSFSAHGKIGNFIIIIISGDHGGHVTGWPSCCLTDPTTEPIRVLYT